MYISTGRGANMVLTDEKVQDVLASMRSRLRMGEVDAALENGVNLIGLVLAGQAIHFRDDAAGGSWMVGLFLIAVTGLFVWAWSKRNRYQECERRIRQLQEDKDLAKSNAYKQTSCPICFSSWLETTSTAVLECGHKFCEECISQWAKKSNSCPICRKPIVHGDVNRAGSETRLQSMDQYGPEMNFRLNRLHDMYPDYVTQSMINRWRDPCYQGSMISDQDFVALAPQVRDSARVSGSRGAFSSFGGGSSSGGGGGGSSW